MPGTPSLADVSADFDDLDALSTAAVPHGKKGKGSKTNGHGALGPLGLMGSRQGYRASLENVCRALQVPGFWLRCALDDFRCELMVQTWDSYVSMSNEMEPLTHGMMLAGRCLLERAGFAPVGAELMRDACRLVGEGNRFDSAKQWLAKQRWDGVPRIERFFIDFMNVPESPYARACGRYWWTGLVARIEDPGAQVDMVIVLVGGQGVGKTRACKAMAPFPDAYTTIDLGHRDADSVRRMASRIIYELSELKGLGAKDQEAIKSFITEQYDIHVPKYQELAVRTPRRGMFIGTSNRREFLDDETGNRRWLPLEVGDIDVEGIQGLLEQLYAEALATYRVDGIDYLEAEQTAGANHDRFSVQDDVWQEVIEGWLHLRSNPQDPFTTRDVAAILSIDDKAITRQIEMRLGRILRGLGMARQRSRDSRGVRKYFWNAK